MTKNKHAVVQGIVISRRNLIELIVVTILLALGINLVAGQLLALAIVGSSVLVLVGAILCIISVLYLTARLFGRRIKSYTYDAFIIYNKKNEIVPVPRYEFSEEVSNYIKGAFVENPALETVWKKEPLKDFSALDYAKDKSKRPKSGQLLTEAAEYFLLSSLYPPY